MGCGFAAPSSSPITSPTRRLRGVPSPTATATAGWRLLASGRGSDWWLTRRLAIQSRQSDRPTRNTSYLAPSPQAAVENLTQPSAAASTVSRLKRCRGGVNIRPSNAGRRRTVMISRRLLMTGRWATLSQSRPNSWLDSLPPMVIRYLSLCWPFRSMRVCATERAQLVPRIPASAAHG